MRKSAGVLFLLAILCGGSALAQQVATVTRSANVPSFVGWVPDEFVIKFADNAGTLRAHRTSQGMIAFGIPEFDALSSQFAVSDMRKEFVMAERGSLSRYVVVKFSKGGLDEVMAAYRNNPMVEKVEPIGIHTVSATPNDGFYAQQWHMNRANDADVDAPEAWGVQTGQTNIIVADLDTGVRYYHKDLGGSAASSTNPGGADGNMWVNWAEKNGTAGVDDDGNGYVDDWIGYDWVTATTSCWSGEDCSTPDNDPRDFNGHGTHTAGLVAAITNNGYAVTSVAGGWGTGTNTPTANGVKLMGLRIGWSAPYLGLYEVGYVRMDFAASAFIYAARNGAKIATCSWGSSNSGGIAEAIDTFLARGGMIFKAAGNDNTQTADYMCARTDIISVAATDSNDCKADFSTYGTWVDISSPGTGIMSTYHDHANPANDYVATMDGTSMATPLAASVAALIWSRHPDWTAAQVKTRLLSTADPIDGKACNSSFAGKLGSGRVNAYNAVNDGPVCDVAAQFVGSPTSGIVPLTVNFTDQSTGPVTTWSWTFGDGGTSVEQSPVHTYAAAGTYTVALTVTSATCSNTNTKTNYITVTVPTINLCATNISVVEERVSRKYRAKATVTVKDAGGVAVPGATVTGYFNYPNTSSKNATTDANGIAVLYSDNSNKTRGFCFSVTNITKTGYTYSAGAGCVTNGCEAGVVINGPKNGQVAALIGVPSEFSLEQNYPNPFNPTTLINFSLPTASSVTLEVYNVMGQSVRTLVNGTLGAGPHSVEWNSTDDNGQTVASGVYLYRLNTGTEVLTKKMLLMK